MLHKTPPQPLEAVKGEVSRFVGDLLQRCIQKSGPEAPGPSNPAETPKSEQQAAEKPGQIEFVSSKAAAPAAPAKAANNAASFFASLPVEILGEFQKKIPVIGNTFNQEMNTIYRQVLVKPEKKSRKKSDDDIEALSLIDDETLMFRLVLDHFSTRVNEQFKIGIAMVCMRFEKVLGFEIDLFLSPLAPFTISSSIEKAVSTLQLDASQRKQLLMAILKALILDYAQLLKLANDIFIKQGVLPKLTEKDAKERIEKYLRKMKAEEEGLDDEDEDGKGEGDGGFAKDFFKNIAIPQESEHFVVSNPNGVMIPQAHLLNNIAQMQAVLVNTDMQTGYMQPLQTQNTFSELLAQNSDIGEYALTSENSKTISIVSMLFDTLKNEEGISGPIKALLIQLTIPLLKAALQDDEFFSDKANPAQVLFNSIAEASSSWQAENSVSNDFLYQKMSDIVQKVTGNFEEDYSVFETAVDDFSSYVDKEKEKSQRIEERIVANETAQERIKAARKLAQQKVFDAFGDYILDEGLKGFIDKSWEHALFFIANNSMDDESNPQWRQVDKIVNTLKSILDYEPVSCTLDQLFGDIIRLLVSTGRAEPDVRKELAQVRPELQVLMDDAEGEATVKPVAKPVVLAQAPVSLVKDDDVDYIRDADIDELDQLDTVDAETVLDDEISSDIDDYEKNFQADQEARMHELLGKVVIGGWFEDKESDPSIKVKLAAHIKYTDTYVFVNRKGIKAASYDGPTLATRLQEKSMVMVDYANLYDRSMENIIGNLRH